MSEAMTLNLSGSQAIDRALGAVVGSAAGDALAIPYASSPALLQKLQADKPVPLASAGQWQEGEWASSTAMDLPVLEALVKKMDPASDDGQTFIAERWINWSGKGMDDRLKALFADAAERDVNKPDEGKTATGPNMANAARKQDIKKWGKSDLNRAPARISALALGYLGDGQEKALVDAAQKLTDLTQPDEDAREASALVALGIRNTILTGDPKWSEAIEFLGPIRKNVWTRRITDAEKSKVEDFSDNKTSHGAFQAAIAALNGAKDVQAVLDRAVRGGGESDRVAAIAGALAGAKSGASKLPAWWQKLYGWPTKVDAIPDQVNSVMTRYEFDEE